MSSPVVALRPMVRADLPTLSAWLDEPLVARWWCDPSDLASLEREHGAALDGRDATRLRIASHEGTDIGFLQWYCWADEPSYVAELAPTLAVPAGAAGLDYLVGAAEHRGRGLGRAMITAALAEVRAAGATCVVVPVHADNAASWRLLASCGFTLAALADLAPDNPADSREHVVYRLDLA